MASVWICLLCYAMRLSVSQFSKLSSTSTLSNKASYDYCSVLSWFSTAQNTESFMITFSDREINADGVMSNIISFSPPPSHSYYYQSTVEISNTSISDSHSQYIEDVAYGDDSILFLSTYYDSNTYNAYFLLYRLVTDYHDPMNIQKGPIRKLKINPSSTSHTPHISATKLFNTDTFIVINNYNDDIYYYIFNQTSQRIESSYTLLSSTSSMYSSECGLAVRASKVSERYLMIWQGHQCDIYGELRSNDGAVVRSQFPINRVQHTYNQYIQDMMALRVTDNYGFFAILYRDASDSVNQTLRICVLDDYGSHLTKDNDVAMEVVLFANSKVGHTISSAKFTEVDITSQNKLYIAVTFAYELNNDDDSAVYIQLIEFAWSDEYTAYNLTTLGDPYEITSSSTDDPHSVCIGCVNNKILVAWLNQDTEGTNIKLLSTDIEVITASPVAADIITASPVSADIITASPVVAEFTTKRPVLSPMDHQSTQTVSGSSSHATFNVSGTVAIVIGVFVITCIAAIVYMFKKRQKASEQTRNLIESATDHDPFNIVLPELLDDMDQPADQDTVHAKNRLSRELQQYVMAMQNNTIIDMDQNRIEQVLNDYHVLMPNSNMQFNDCTASNCVIYRRHYRDSSSARNENEKQMDVYTPKYCAKLDILDKIHCFCEHSSMIVPRVADDEKSNTNVLDEFKKRMSNKYNQLHVVSDDENHGNVFVLGWEVKYVQNMDEIKEKDNECVYVTPRYKSLQEELTSCELTPVLMAQFLCEYYKAQRHHNSYHKRQCYANIGLNHVLALMIYCNFDFLQCTFSKTYRENQGKDHRNFYHFGKLLKEAVLNYGTCIRDGMIDSFYHGMNQRLVPTQIVGDLGKGIRIFVPLSTSSNIEIALNFADQGLIMTFGGRTSEAKYFCVAWLSDFGYEKERLFLQNKNELHIQNVTECNTNTSFGWILDRLKAMDYILCEAHYAEVDSSKYELLGDIIYFINHQLSIKKRGKRNPIVPVAGRDLSGYAQELLAVYFENKEKLTINCCVLKNKYRELFELICFEKVMGNTEISKEKYQWIRMDVLVAIFPRLKNIEVKDINLCDEIMKDISNNRKLFGHQNKTSKLPTMKLRLRVNKNSTLKAVDATSQYERAFLDNSPKLFINPVDVSNMEYDTIVIK
eukprot:118983_1